MKSLVALLMCSCMTFVAGNAIAASHTEKGASAPMAQDGMMKKEMSMQDCKDHMAMAKKGDAMAKKDDAMMKKDDAMMKKDEPMKK